MEQNKLTWDVVDEDKEYVFLDSPEVKEKLRNKKGKFIKIYHGSLPIHPFAEFEFEDGKHVEVRKNDICKLTEVN